MNNVVVVRIAVVDAAAFSCAEKQKLIALLQSRQASDDVDSELSAPVAAANFELQLEHCGCAQRCDEPSPDSGSWTKRATLSEVLLTTSSSSSSPLRTSQRRMVRLCESGQFGICFIFTSRES